MKEQNAILQKLYEMLEIENSEYIIYGARLIATEVYRYICEKKYKGKFRGFAVTSIQDNSEEVEGFKVNELIEYAVYKNIVVIVAMPQKFHDEVTQYAHRVGFSRFIYIGQENMEGIKSEWMLNRFYDDKYCIYEDEFDKSWLNIIARGDKDTLRSTHYKFPTLFYLKENDIKKYVEEANLIDDFELCFGQYRNLHTLGTEDIGECDFLKVYMAFSQWDNGERKSDKYPPWIIPIQAGSALSEVCTDNMRDDIGDNISSMNRGLAELTVAYWIWKNEQDAKYKGICHYRRFFLLNEKEISNFILNDVDVVLTTPRYVPGGIRKMFIAETPVNELVFENLLLSVKNIHENEYKEFGIYINNSFYVPNNMVIAKNDIYNAYCEWLFPVIFEMIKNDEKAEYGHKFDRHVAYAAEILTSFYFSQNKDLNIYYTDYRFTK